MDRACAKFLIRRCEYIFWFYFHVGNDQCEEFCLNISEFDIFCNFFLPDSSFNSDLSSSKKTSSGGESLKTLFFKGLQRISRSLIFKGTYIPSKIFIICYNIYLI